jgi:hypothetical protein
MDLYKLRGLRAMRGWSTRFQVNGQGGHEGTGIYA